MVKKYNYPYKENLDIYDLVWHYITEIHDYVDFDLMMLIARAGAIFNKNYSHDYVEEGMGERGDEQYNTRYLMTHGFADIIHQIFNDVEGKSMKEKNIIYLKWLKVLKRRILVYVISKL